MKFDNVKTDEDTVVISQVECMFAHYNVLYQKWCWESVKAESLIFFNEDIVDVKLNDLVNDIQNSLLVNDPKAEITTSINEQYTFINFNFITN